MKNGKMKRKNVKSVYILRTVTPEIHRDGRKGHYLRDEEGNFKCSEQIVGVFDSVREAERTIRRLVEIETEENERWNGWDTYFGFILTEHYVNDVFFHGDNVSHFESMRSYLSDGTLNYHSNCDCRCEKKFRGTDMKSFSVGEHEIALVFSGDVLIPVLVGELPFSKEEWKERFAKDAFGDATDDSGVVFTAYNGHEHPFGPRVFPLSCLPHVKIGKKLIEKMKREWDSYYLG